MVVVQSIPHPFTMGISSLIEVLWFQEIDWGHRMINANVKVMLVAVTRCIHHLQSVCGGRAMAEPMPSEEVTTESKFVLGSFVFHSSTRLSNSSDFLQKDGRGLVSIGRLWSSGSLGIKKIQGAWIARYGGKGTELTL